MPAERRPAPARPGAGPDGSGAGGPGCAARSVEAFRKAGGRQTIGV